MTALLRRFDTDNSGSIESFELLDATDAHRANDLTTSEMQRVRDAYQSHESFTATAGTESPDYDVNDDGTVDSRDAAELFEGVTSEQAVPSRFDFNDDGSVDVVDVQWLRQRYGSGESEPAPSAPSESVDNPTQPSQPSDSNSSGSSTGLTETQLMAVAAAVVAAAALWGTQ